MKSDPTVKKALYEAHAVYRGQLVKYDETSDSIPHTRTYLLLLLLMLLLLLLLSSQLPRSRGVPERSCPGEPPQVLLDLLAEGAELLGHRGAPLAAVGRPGRSRPAPPPPIGCGLRLKERGR